ncbi:MAG: hypothetical protein RJA61_447 [Candidatus Parcubacteria bacterium]|jgi:hypothetical protein
MGVPKLEPEKRPVLRIADETVQIEQSSELQVLMEKFLAEGVVSINDEDSAAASAQEEVVKTSKPPPQESPERSKLLHAQKIAKTHRELLRLVRSSLWLKIFIPKAIKTFLSEAYRTIPLPALEQAHQVTLRHSLLCRKVDSLGWIRRRLIGQFYSKICTELGLERKEIGEGLHCS